MRVLFVCETNTTSSPLAAGLLYHHQRTRPIGDLSVGSAGFAAAGTRISRPVVDLLADRGVDASRKRSQVLTADLVAAADLVLTMTRRQRDRVVADFAQVDDRTFPLRWFVAGLQPRDPVVDPNAWLDAAKRAARTRVVTVDPVWDLADTFEPGRELALADPLAEATSHFAATLAPRAPTSGG